MTQTNHPNIMKYHASIRILHLLIALIIIFMLFSGLTDGKIPAGQGKLIFYWHKSLGLTLIVLFTLRVIARISTNAPQLPVSFSQIEAFAARFGHVLLYIFGTLTPISGYLMTTAGGKPVKWFNTEIPPIIVDKSIAKFAYKSHEILAWALLALVIGHALAVIKHYIFKKENLLKRIG